MGRVPFRLLSDPQFCVLLTVEEVARLLKVSRATVYGLVEREQLPAVRVGHSMRVRAEDVDALCRNR
jgi:putative molybdopterin biosynthesis protein